jgi:hypothetical protein
MISLDVYRSSATRTGIGMLSETNMTSNDSLMFRTVVNAEDGSNQQIELYSSAVFDNGSPANNSIAGCVIWS